MFRIQDLAQEPSKKQKSGFTQEGLVRAPRTWSVGFRMLLSNIRVEGVLSLSFGDTWGFGFSVPAEEVGLGFAWFAQEAATLTSTNLSRAASL